MIGDAGEGGNELLNECMQLLSDMGFTNSQNVYIYLFPPLLLSQHLDFMYVSAPLQGEAQSCDKRKLHLLIEALDYDVDRVIHVLCGERAEADRVVREYVARREAQQRAHGGNGQLPRSFPR